MGNSEPKNTKKYAVIITYTIAVICLLLGFLLPVFYGKGVQGMLVMQLPDALDIVCGGKGVIKLGNSFVASYYVSLFGIAKASVDITAWAVVLYAVITFFALLAFIPMGVTFKKGGKVTKIFAYVIEIAAALVLSLYVITALEYAQDSKLPEILNIWVAFGGTLLMLIIQCFVNKSGKTAAVKFILFILSTVAICTLFTFYFVSPAFSKLWLNLADVLKCSPDLYGYSSGIDFVNVVFAGSFIDAFKAAATATNKTVLILGAIISVFTLLNFFIDIIGLSTNAKRKGLIFNTIRYGIPFLAAICLFITVAVAKDAQGLALSLLFVIIAIELAINLGILLAAVVKSKKQAAKEKVVHSEQQLEYGVNDYANFERKPERAQEVPDYSDNPNPYVNPYTQPFGSDQPSYLNPFGNAGFKTNPTEIEPEPEQHAAQEKPAPAYDPTLGYPPEYVNPSQEYKTPVQEYNPVQDYRNYQPVQDYQPAKQPVKNEQPKEEPTVHNVYSTYPPTPQQETPERVYRVNTVYQGPTDEFLRKLTNDEKIEFAMIFIERSKGEIGKVPEYAIGGDNKKFFSSVFIYLGRIRGIISDGLLNKMYKEINMFR
ncbi:MAG: hypothetical protein K2J83_03185 [Clostridia bacterium]|nr:hypothetical protein [Clostridia bacterium]